MSAERIELRVARLEDAFVRLVQLAENTDSRMDRIEAGIEALTEAQTHTEERLNALINTVERYISEGRNGKA